MITLTRSVTWAASIVLMGSLAACAPYPTQGPSYPQYPQTQPQQQVYPSGGYQNQNQNQYQYQNQQNAPYGTEYGRVSNIETLQNQARGQTSGAGAVLGGVVGAVLGNQVGGGSGRAAATAVGAIGGALLGNTVEGRNNNQGAYEQGYRITIQLDQGGLRAYDVSSPGDLRMGDRVRLYNGQISRQ